jgi:predicted HTH domain antitoxin
MTLTIPGEIVEKNGLSEREALIELACRLFDIGKLDLWTAAQLAALGREEFEDELIDRNIAVYRPSLEDLEADLATLRHLRGKA